MSFRQKLPFFSKPAAPGRPPWLAGGALIGSVAVVALLSLGHFRQQEIEDWQRRADRIARSTALSGAEAFASPAIVLDSLSARLRTGAIDNAGLRAALREPSVAQQMRDHIRLFPGIEAAFVVAADGTLLAAEGSSAAADPVVRRNVAQANGRDSAGDGIRIGAPFRQRDGKRAYLLSRPLRAAQGEPLGTIVLALPVTPLAALLGRNLPDDGLEVSLLRNDQVPLAAWPAAGAAVPASWERRPGAVMAMHPIDGYPALVRVAAADEVVLRRWHLATRATAATALCGAIALLIALGLLYRARRQRDIETENAATLRREAEQAAQDRLRFLSRMRHDIRTPMNGVLGMTEILLQSNLTREQRQYAATIQESGRSLLKIMDDLIDDSRREDGAAAPAMETAAAELPAPAARPRVLVAEDSEVNRQLIQILLARMGCDVRFAENGRQALDALAREGADLVLMDCMMPVMDGYEAVRRLRDQEARAGARRLPVIALTGSATGDEKAQCLAAGMDDYLAKPFTGAGFTALVGRWLAG